MEDTEKFVGKFIGPARIESIEDTGVTTVLGSPILRVKLSSGGVETFPLKGLETIVSDEAKDFNHVRDARFAQMVPQMMAVVMEYDVPFDQFTSLMTEVASQFQNHFNRANAILWFGSADEYIPGSDTQERLTLTMAEVVNRGAKKDAE